MMEILNNLAFGFEHALTLENLMYCALGCTVGTLIGLLPGLGPLSTISLLLPITYTIPTGGALIMLAGIYYGAQYGDSVSAITMKIPHASSIVACIDGYQMNLKGKTGLALFTAGLSSFIGGTVAIVVLSTMAPALGEVGLFGPADYCALMLLGFFCVSFVSAGSLLNGLAMALIGILLGSIGTDVNSGLARYTMDMAFLQDGVGLISIALGCFGIAEIVKNLDARNTLTPFNGKIAAAHLAGIQAHHSQRAARQRHRLGAGHPARRRPDHRAVRRLCRRQALQQAPRRDRQRRDRGRGRPGRGRRGRRAHQLHPAHGHRHSRERRDGADAGGLHRQGIQPGPNMIGTHPDLFWGLVASMWIGNCFLLILNVPLVRYWLSVFKIPYTVLFPSILFFCCIGTFSINNSLDDIYITAVFGAIGYLFMRLGMEPAPLMLGFILGPMLEENFRRAMLLSRGDFSTFVTRPISGTLFGVIGLIVVWQLVSFMRNSRKKDAPALHTQEE